MTPSFRGAAIFGVATTVKHVPNANAQQVAAFFGVQGVQSLWGGGRGRVFEVSGLLLGVNPTVVRQAEALLLSYGDGVAGTLIDTTGTSWSNCVFHSEYIPGDQFVYIPYLGYWGLPYRAVIRGLT